MLDVAVRDSRLQPALRALQEGTVKVLALDCFDTLLWRTVPEPIDAFVVLGRRLAERGMLPPQFTPVAFARMRQRAEQLERERAAARGESWEIDLHTIWRGFPAFVLDGRPVDEYVSFEVDLERSILVPDLEVSQLARLAQDHFSARIVLISDTYFNEQQLRSLLQHDDIGDLRFDEVFPSCKHLVAKGNGLWKVVLADLGVDAASIVHIGDNPHADVTVPAGLGVRTVPYLQRSDWLRTVLSRERVLFVPGGPIDKPTLSEVRGDAGLTGLRSKVLSRQSRLADPVDNPYRRFGAAVMGPVLVSFAEWVVRGAAQLGVDRVYPVMREGEFLTRLINAAAMYMNSTVRAIPLWLSRQVCAKAALATGSRAELERFLGRGSAPTVRQFCDTLGLRTSEIPELLDAADLKLDDPETRSRVLDLLADLSAARDRIVANSVAARRRLMTYFQTTTEEASTVVLADLGWGGTIQEGLNSALCTAESPVHTVGLYLVTSWAAVDRTLDGMVSEGFLAGFGAPEFVSRWVARSPEIIEQICTSDDGTLLDFSSEGAPITASNATPAAQSLQRVAVQAGVLDFQDERSRYHALLEKAVNEPDPDINRQLQRILTRFILSPTTEEAALFAEWCHDENFGSDASAKVIPNKIAGRLRHMTPRELLELPVSDVYWPFGAAVLHHPRLGMAAEAVANGDVPDGAFASEEVVNLQVWVDSRASSTERDGVEVRRSMGGGYVFRTEFASAGISTVDIEWKGASGILRVDVLRMVFSLADAHQVELRLDTPAGLRTLAVRNGVALADGLFMGNGDALRLSWRNSSQWSGQVTRAEIELEFDWLPCRRGAGPPTVTPEPLLARARRSVADAGSYWKSRRREHA